MQVERSPMPVFQKVIYILSFIFLIAAFIYLGTKNFNAPVRNLTDQESFTKEYGITSDNVFYYKTGKEILETMNTGTAIIFFAFPENMWSHTYADMLNEVAKYFGIKKGELDLLSGGAPCQAFSYAGKRLGFGDTRGTLFAEFARCVKESSPKMFLFENVKGLLSHDNGRTFNTIKHVFENLGYKIQYNILNACYFGVGQ